MTFRVFFNKFNKTATNVNYSDKLLHFCYDVVETVETIFANKIKWWELQCQVIKNVRFVLKEFQKKEQTNKQTNKLPHFCIDLNIQN